MSESAATPAQYNPSSAGSSLPRMAPSFMGTNNPNFGAFRAPMQPQPVPAGMPTGGVTGIHAPGAFGSMNMPGFQGAFGSNMGMQQNNQQPGPTNFKATRGRR